MLRFSTTALWSQVVKLEGQENNHYQIYTLWLNVHWLEYYMLR